MKGIMKFAYLVCFLALLQVSTSDVTVAVDSNTTTTDMEYISTESNTLNTSDTNVTDLSPEVSTAASTVADEEADSESYSAAADETSTVEEEKHTTVQPSPHSYATFLQPSVLALVVPVCLRLSSIKLFGVV